MNEELETNGLEFEDEVGEDDNLNIPPERRQIYTQPSDPEVESLYNKYKRGRLVIQADFQRKYVWDKKKASRLIESAILDIPLPVIYISEDIDSAEYVIDGQQRLTSFFAYIDGKFPDGSDFKLTGLDVFTDLNKKLFSELDEKLQDKIKYCTLRTITFKKNSDHNLKFEIFERLNTGSVSLNDQELRNCIYRGPYNSLLKTLAEDADFRYILGLKGADKRMRDVELVLRFAAFYHNTYLKYKRPMRSFFNEDMERFKNISASDEKALKTAFKNSVTIVKSLLDKNAFKRFRIGNEDNPDGYWEPKRFNASLYDVLMYSFADLDKTVVHRHLDEIREAWIDLMTNNEQFIEAIEIGTSDDRRVHTRFDLWRQRLKSIIGSDKKEARCFSMQLKQQMYKIDPTCSICGQCINGLDDAAIDHITQYWTGGRTIPENARLTHRYCNWSRSRRE
jgi:hypothetical protein